MSKNCHRIDLNFINPYPKEFSKYSHPLIFNRFLKFSCCYCTTIHIYNKFFVDFQISKFYLVLGEHNPAVRKIQNESTLQSIFRKGVTKLYKFFKKNSSKLIEIGMLFNLNIQLNF